MSAFAPATADNPLIPPAPPVQGVLVIDDNDAVRALLKTILQMAGFVVWTARDGAEGVALFDHHRDAVAAALIDLIMPGMNGPQTLRALHAVAPDLPACFISGFTDGCLADQCPDAAEVPLLHKPFQVAEVLARVRAMAAR